VLNAATLKQLLGDPELRAGVSQLLAEKVRADAKSLEINAQLSRYLFDLARRGGTPEETAQALRLSIKEHLDFYLTLVRMTLAFNERLSAQLRELSGHSQAPAQPMTMNIAASLGETVRSGFQLENNRSRPISVGFEITPFASEDGRQLVAADIAFDPPSLELRPGQEERIELILRIVEPFRPEAIYFATLTVTGLETTQLLVRLRVGAQQEVPAPVPLPKAARKQKTKGRAGLRRTSRAPAPEKRSRTKATP
jgi:hypothetical protein